MGATMVKLEGSQFTDLGDVHQSSMLATNHFEQDHVLCVPDTSNKLGT